MTEASEREAAAKEAEEQAKKDAKARESGEKYDGGDIPKFTPEKKKD